MASLQRSQKTQRKNSTRKVATRKMVVSSSKKPSKSTNSFKGKSIPHSKTKKGVQINSHHKFYDLFVGEIEELYSAKNQVLNNLSRLAKLAVSKDLKQCLQNHEHECQNQIKRLQKIFQILGERTQPHFCYGIDGILKESSAILAQYPKSLVKDVAIIASAQKIAHYEIAAYGIAKAHARHLNFGEIYDLLDESLNEEATEDKNLTKFAEGTFFFSGINRQAIKEELGAYV